MLKRRGLRGLVRLHEPEHLCCHRLVGVDAHNDIHGEHVLEEVRELDEELAGLGHT